MSVFQHIFEAIDGQQPGAWRGRIGLRRGEFLERAGACSRRLYFVEAGALRVYTLLEGEEHTVRFAYRGSFTSALDAYVSGQPTAYYIQALKRAELRWLYRHDMEQIFLADAALRDRWYALMEQFAVQQMARELDLLTPSPAERYRRVLARSPQLFQEVPHKYIAAYLRMTPETLSRLKKNIARRDH